MKGASFFVAIIAVTTFGAAVKIPKLHITFELLDPGFSVDILEFDGLDVVEFHANINKRLRDEEQGQYYGPLITCDRDEELRVCFRNDKVEVFKHDVINYWLKVQYAGDEVPTSVEHYTF